MAERCSVLTQALAAFVLCASSTLAMADELAALQWMTGSWADEADGRWSEERWSPPRGGAMLGTSRFGQGDRAKGFEFMRISLDETGKPVFWGSPQGTPAVPFALKSMTATTVVFENPAHDFPNTTTYERTTDGLKATIAGKDGKSMSWQWTRVAQ